MSDIALLAVGLAVAQALAPRRDAIDAGVAAFVLVLTATADRALFGGRHRPFWLGFTAAGWLVVAAALTYHQETRGFVLRHGPPVVRAREDLQRQHAALAHAQALGLSPAPPLRVSEWYLLGSFLAEMGLRLAAGVLAASVGGLFASAVAALARWAGRQARRMNVPDPSLTRT
jgi:hypothetical protein